MASWLVDASYEMEDMRTYAHDTKLSFQETLVKYSLSVSYCLLLSVIIPIRISDRRITGE